MAPRRLLLLLAPLAATCSAQELQELPRLAERVDAFHFDVGFLGEAPEQNGTGLVAYNGTELVARRLFSFHMPDVSSMCSQASDWVSSAASTIGNAVGLPDLVKIFDEAKQWVSKGLEVAMKGWTSMIALKDHMLRIFTDFSPLKKVFADENGLMSLITSLPNMQTLIKVVQELLGTSTVLSSLTGALHSVSDLFVKVEGFFHNALSKVTGGRRLRGDMTPEQRRLAGGLSEYTSLLNGLNFKQIVGIFKGFMPKLDQVTKTLGMVDRTLGPILKKLGGVMSTVAQGQAGYNRIHGATSGSTYHRRLSSVDMQHILKDQQKYSQAISSIVPTWQSVEQHGIDLCPHVADAQSGAGSLQCRVADFAKQAALPSWVSGMVSSVVSGCPQPKSTTSDVGKCPKKSSSAGISDLLGKNANFLGLIVAVLVGIGVLGGGGAAGAAAMKGGGGGDETSSASESESGSEAELMENRQ